MLGTFDEGIAMSLHNDPTGVNAYTRRLFLGKSLAFASAAATVPSFIQSSALGMPMPGLGLSSIPGVDEGRILVIVQLGGGNDGLNTVVPVGHDDYYRVRPTIGIAKQNTLDLDRGRDVALHPAMEGIKSLYDDGLCALVQGTGYPNPNRSHFQSMDVWHTADTSGTGAGWIGRYLDSECCGFGKGESGQEESETPSQPAIAIGRTAPLAMEGGRIKPVAFESADLFRWTGSEIHGSLEKPYEQLTMRGSSEESSEHPMADFLMKTALDAQVSSDLIRKAVSKRPMTQFPATELGRQLQMVSSMIRAGLNTRVYYVSMGGFDTHAGQGNVNGSHANLLRQFGDALRAFYTDLKRQENDGRVLTMCFSEFGRRVGQNASGGTDHGTAAPMFLFGPMVRQGVIGDHPSLRDLDNGDLKYKIDFRSVYAGILEDWLSADSNEILKARYRPLSVLV